MVKKIICIGAMPPPVHGMSKNFKNFVDDIKCVKPVFVIDTSPGSLTRSLSYHLIKFVKFAKGLLALLLIALFGRSRTLYICPDGGMGLIYSFCFISLLNLFKYRIFIHHRSFAYIRNESNFMRIISNMKHGKIEHVFLCEKMKSEFEHKYGYRGQSSIVSNSKFINYTEKKGRDHTKTLHVGHMSNLSKDKGVFAFLEICRLAQEECLDVKFLLAGPFETSVESEEGQLILKDLKNVEYIGPIYGQEKNEFFRKIDVFVFPSNYQNEAQPNVVFEAQAFGNIVIAYENACVGSDINCETGFLLNDIENFSVDALDIIRRLTLDRDVGYTLSDNSIVSVENSKLFATEQYNSLLNRVINSCG
jgi:glycosyltransferase involved in cell wall biosynthesis